MSIQLSLHLRFAFLIVAAATFPFLAGCRPATDRSEESSTPTIPQPADAPPYSSSLMADLDSPPPPISVETASLDVVFPILADIHDTLGIEFVYENGHSSTRRMNESAGGGAGWLDFDLDGLLDLYCVQAGPSDAVERSSNQPDVLFRNQGGRFEEIGELAGIEDRKYGYGIAIADFDADGFHDIYVTNVGRDTLYKNLGDGTFADMTMECNTINYLWGSSAAWSDLNADGLLDLYVCNYLDYDPANPIACYDDNGVPRICHPDNVGPVPNRLFISKGDGTFEECLKSRGMDAENSKSLGVVVADFNQDSSPDIFVANDTTYNHLFLNDGTGHFQENGVASGCAVSGRGQFQASMGVAFGDYNRDGLWDLYLTHFTSDSNTLYRGLGGGGFLDVTREESLHEPTLAFLAFGTVMMDLDCNGSDELFVVNGDVDASDGDAWKMTQQLFVYNGRSWIDCTNRAGECFRKEYLGRGVAVGDLDDDGYAEIAVINQGDEACILRSQERKGHWLNVSFLSESANRHGIGAVVTVEQSGGKLVQVLAGGTSYCASHQQKLFFGLGDNGSSCLIRVRWPNGREQVLENVALNQHLVVRDRGI